MIEYSYLKLRKCMNTLQFMNKWLTMKGWKDLIINIYASIYSTTYSVYNWRARVQDKLKSFFKSIWSLQHVYTCIVFGPFFLMYLLSVRVKTWRSVRKKMFQIKIFKKTLHFLHYVKFWPRKKILAKKHDLITNQL